MVDKAAESGRRRSASRWRLAGRRAGTRGGDVRRMRSSTSPPSPTWAPSASTTRITAARFVESAARGGRRGRRRRLGLPAPARTASQTAVEVTLRAYRGAGRGRGARQAAGAGGAAGEHRRSTTWALVVPELRGMATTLTAVAIDGGELVAAHVGDCRLYLLRDGAGHPAHQGPHRDRRAGAHGPAEREAGARPPRSVDADAQSRPRADRRRRSHRDAACAQGDVLILCSDGLYNVLEAGDDGDRELAVGTTRSEPPGRWSTRPTRAARPTTSRAAVVRMMGARAGATAERCGVLGRLARLRLGGARRCGRAA